MVRRMAIARQIGPSMTRSPIGMLGKAKFSCVGHAVRDDRRFFTASPRKGSIRLWTGRHQQDIKGAGAATTGEVDHRAARFSPPGLEQNAELRSA
jgi:hypothetical protein